MTASDLPHWRSSWREAALASSTSPCSQWCTRCGRRVSNCERLRCGIIGDSDVKRRVRHFESQSGLISMQSLASAISKAQISYFRVAASSRSLSSALITQSLVFVLPQISTSWTLDWFILDFSFGFEWGCIAFSESQCTSKSSIWWYCESQFSFLLYQ